MKLLGVLMIIYGAFVACIPPFIGIIVAWLPIWMGILLFSVGSKVDTAYQGGNKADLVAGGALFALIAGGGLSALSGTTM